MIKIFHIAIFSRLDLLPATHYTCLYFLESYGGPWVVQFFKYLTPGFGSGPNLRSWDQASNQAPLLSVESA